MAELIVVTGPPGAGKSTLAPELADRFDPSALVAGDDFFAFVRRGYVEPWLDAAHEQNTAVVTAAGAAAGALVRGGFTVVYEGIVDPQFIGTFLAAAGLATMRYVVLLPSLEQCLGRVGTRTGQGFSDADATRHMYGRFADTDRRFVVEPDVDEIRVGLATGQFVCGDPDRT